MPIYRAHRRFIGPYARQQGVCVYPVKGLPTLDFTSLPHWMRSAHFYDLEHEWPKLLNDLNTRCQQPRVPLMVEDLPADYSGLQAVLALVEPCLGAGKPCLGNGTVS